MKENSSNRKAMGATGLLFLGTAVLVLTALASHAPANAEASTSKPKIFAQTLVEETLAKHPELEGLGLATSEPHGKECVTIADTDPKELGDKCDKGELGVMKSGKSTVEKEGDGYDVTYPLHVQGKIIGIIGMDFKLDQQEASLLDRANGIASEIEKQIPAKSKLFEAAK